MKLLKLLSEDWKDEINKDHADFALWIGTIYYPSNTNFKGLGSGATYYNIIESKAVELTPEPRPADSIKLSECDGKHIIVGMYRNNICKAVNVQHEWLLSLEVGNAFDRRDDLVFLLRNMSVTDIKIYDITQ